MAYDKLTKKIIDTAQPEEKPYRLSDGRASYLYVTPTGFKSWRLDYCFAFKRKTIVIGQYPEMSLEKFREKVIQFRSKVMDNIDPMVERKRTEKYLTFEKVSRYWLEKVKAGIASKSFLSLKRCLEIDILPYIGRYSIYGISRLDLKKVLASVEARGVEKTAYKDASILDRIFQYAVDCGYLVESPAIRIHRVLKKAPETQHRRGETDPIRLGVLLRNIDVLETPKIIKTALQLIPLLAVRSNELCDASWREFDLETGTWTIPACRMKCRKKHIVPLSVQALSLLKEHKEKSNSLSPFCFPSPRNRRNSIRPQSLLMALRKAGGKDLDIHGFRGTFSTLCRENRFASNDVIELCLSHTVGNIVSQAYNHSELMEERRALMQRWADYLDSLKQ